MQTPIPKRSIGPASTPDPERALLQHLPIVRSIAQRIHARLPRHVDIEDLYSAGLLGLMEAYAKFNPAKDVKFVTFAQFRIRGAIFDTLRSLDWAPRELRNKGRAVQEAIRVITARTGHSPSEDQVAQELNTSLTSYQKLLGDLHNLEIGTLYRNSEDNSTEEELIYISGRPEEDPLFCCMKADMVDRLINAVAVLPERERLVLTLYYYEELTRSEIAVVLGMDGNRVSQIRASAVLHLRAALSNHSRRHSRNITGMHCTGGTLPEHATLQMSVA